MEVTVCRCRRSGRGRGRAIPSTCACPSAIQVMPNTHTPRENHPDLRCVRPRVHHLQACRTTRRKAQVRKVRHVWPLGPGTRPHSPTCEELLGGVRQVLCLCPERKGLRRWLVGGSERRVQTVHAGHRPLSLPVRPIDGRELRQCPGIAPSHRRRQQSRCGGGGGGGAALCPWQSTESSPPAATAHATGDAAAHAAGGKSMVPVLSEGVLVASARDTLSGRRCRGRGGGQDPREKGRGEKFILRVAFGNGTPFQRPAAVQASPLCVFRYDF